MTSTTDYRLPDCTTGLPTISAGLDDIHRSLTALTRILTIAVELRALEIPEHLPTLTLRCSQLATLARAIADELTLRPHRPISTPTL